MNYVCVTLNQFSVHHLNFYISGEFSQKSTTLSHRSQAIMRVCSIDEMVRKKRASLYDKCQRFRPSTAAWKGEQERDGRIRNRPIGEGKTTKKQHKLLVRFMACPSGHCASFLPRPSVRPYAAIAKHLMNSKRILHNLEQSRVRSYAEAGRTRACIQ